MAVVITLKTSYITYEFTIKLITKLAVFISRSYNINKNQIYNYKFINVIKASLIKIFTFVLCGTKKYNNLSVHIRHIIEML